MAIRPEDHQAVRQAELLHAGHPSRVAAAEPPPARSRPASSRIARAVTLLAVGALLTAASARATPVLLSTGWDLWTLPGVPQTVFALEDGGVLTVTARHSWGVRYRDAPADAGTRSVLTWAWRVDELSVPAPPVDALHDSRPLAIHVGFDEMPGRKTFWHGLRRAMGALLGFPVWAKVLTYSWGGLGPVDQVFVNPYFPDNGFVRILRPDSEPQGTWRYERVDFGADFARAFGHSAPRAAIIAISADMNASQGQSRGAIRDLRFDDN